MRGRLAPLGDLGSGDAMTWPTEAERQARLHKRAGCNCTEEEAMPIDPDEVKAVHYEVENSGADNYCWKCQCSWPCDAIQLADEVERMREERDSAEDTLRNFFDDKTIQRPVGRAIGEIERLREALEEIRTKPAQAGQGYSFLGGDLREIARVALGKSPSEKGESDD
jgi:hypothetical protein